MEASENIGSGRSSEEILQYAASKAVENQQGFSAISMSLHGAENKVLADQDRAYLLQMLRQLVFNLVHDVIKNLPIRAAKSDVDGIALKALTSDRASQVFDLICATGSLDGGDVIEEAAMRLCVFYTGRLLRQDIAGKDAISSQVGNEYLCDQLAIPVHSPLRTLLGERNRNKFGIEDGFNNPLLCSRELESETRYQLTWLVAAALRHLVVEEMDRLIPAIDDYLEQAISTMSEEAKAADPLSPTSLASGLSDAGFLSAASLSAILKNGDFHLFEAGISQIISVNHRLVRRLIFETGGVCLAVLAKALDLSFEDSIRLRMITRDASRRVILESTEESEEFEKTLSKISRDSANTVCAHWRRRRRFHSAIWELNSALNSLSTEG